MSRIVAAKAKLNKDVHEATGIVRAMAQKLTAELKDFVEDKFTVAQQTEEQRHKAEREAKAEEAAGVPTRSATSSEAQRSRTQGAFCRRTGPRRPT